MAAYRRVYDSRHLQADCQEPGSARNPTLGNRVSATFMFFYACTVNGLYTDGDMASQKFTVGDYITVIL